jgi:hypothetical protein
VIDPDHRQARVLELGEQRLDRLLGAVVDDE